VTLADGVAAVMLAGLVVYAVSGGADFGGGVWHLFASGSRAKEQRRLVDDAIAPIWEANHVWLILVVVLLFVCFPAAFAAASIALNVPLTLLVVGIVLRGAGFAFRQYAATPGMRRRWSRVFTASSAITPFFLGLCLAAVTSGRLVIRDGTSANGFVAPWLHPFGLCVGALTLVLFVFLAAVYLTNETGDAALRDDFRLRALASGVLVGALAFAALALAPAPFRARLLGSWWSWPVQIAAGVAAVGALAALAKRRFRLARPLAIAQAAVVLAGWALAQRPMLIAPEMTIAGAAAPDQVLRLVLLGLGAGTLVIAPSFAWLFRVFKGAGARTE
jgi:cytochrome d ubiquinol oxidase subunit II